MKKLLICGAIALLAACSGGKRDSQQDLSKIDPEKGVSIVYPDQPAQIASLAAVKDYPTTSATYLSYDPVHGFQIEAFDGSAVALWYPGNNIAVLGEWRPGSKEGVTCFKYSTPSRNPVSGQSAKWQCSNRTRIYGYLEGDPFNLLDGTVPYPSRPCIAPPEFEYALDDWHSRNCASGQKFKAQLK